MLLEFTKMHGLGNDFVVINNIDKQLDLNPHWIKSLANRNFGVGFDQMLIVEAPSLPEVEFDYRIFNADGGEVEHCGNGARCFATYVVEKGLTSNQNIAVNTSGGVIELLVNHDKTVTVRMGVPEFTPALIPFSAESQSSIYTLELKGVSVQIGALAIGNPHAVTLVDDVDSADVLGLGAQIECHSRFPNRVNAGFMQVLSRDEIKLRVFERGVGETSACGTGACAAVVSGIIQGHLDHKVKASLRGGDLSIEWNGIGETVLMTGPSTTVFEGRLRI